MARSWGFITPPKKVEQKVCPRCQGAIDSFGSCRMCGREWSEKLEPDEVEGEEEPAELDEAGKPIAKEPEDEEEEPEPKKIAEKKFPKLPGFSLWDVTLKDDETEIIRKRSLLRLVSRRVYTQMGLSVRAHENQRATMMWLQRCWEQSEGEEADQLKLIIDTIRPAFDILGNFRQEKIEQVAQMEKASERVYAKARQARVLAEQKKQKKLQKEKGAAIETITPQQDSEGLGLSPVAINPKLIEDTARELLALEEAKQGKKAKRAKRKKKGD